MVTAVARKLGSTSLRVKYALLVTTLILVPMGVYLLLDLRAERQSILDSRIEVLQSMGHLLVHSVSMSGDPESIQQVLATFGVHHPDLEIMVLDPSERVSVSTEPERVGRVWQEPEIARVLGGELEFASEFGSHEGLPVLEITLPVPGADGSPVAAVHIAESQETLERQVGEALVRDVLFSLALMGLLAVLVNLITDRLIIHRLGSLTRMLQRTGWLPDPDVAPDRADEIHALSGVLSTLLAEIERTTTELRTALDDKQGLLERVEGFNEELTREVQAARDEIVAMQDELLRAERLSTIGELAAGLAHEIRNPLQIIRGTAEMARRRHPEVADSLGDVVEEVVRLNQLVNQLLDYARPLAPSAGVVDVAALVEQAVGEVGAGDLVEVDVPPGLEAWGDEGLLRRVVVNLIANAVEAGGAGSAPIHAVASRRGGEVVLEVRDHGPGIDAEDLERLFTPFFSRKEAGTGLGLCLSRRIVEQQGGTLTLDNVPDGGAVARVVLPAEEVA